MQDEDGGVDGAAEAAVLALRNHSHTSPTYKRQQQQTGLRDSRRRHSINWMGITIPTLGLIN